MSLEIILALIATIPTTATALSTAWLNSQRRKDKEDSIRIAEKNAAKSSIQNMITQDIIRVELLGKLPENKDNIETEYENYHKNGGNGTITRQVAEYNNWYSSKEICFRCEQVVKENSKNVNLDLTNNK